MNNKGFANVIFIGLVILLLAGAGYWYWQDGQASEANDTGKPSPTVVVTLPTVTSEDSYEGWKTYTDEEYGYEIKYPSDWYEWGGKDDPFYLKSKTISYRPETEDATDRVNSIIVVINVADSVETNPAMIGNWDSIEDYFSKIESIPLGVVTPLKSSQWSLNVEVEKTKESESKYGGSLIRINPTDESHTEPYLSDVLYYYKDRQLISVGTRIWGTTISLNNKEMYSIALKIIESFRFLN